MTHPLLAPPPIRSWPEMPAPWMQWFRQLYQRVGQANASDLDDIMQSFIFDSDNGANKNALSAAEVLQLLEQPSQRTDQQELLSLLLGQSVAQPQDLAGLVALLTDSGPAAQQRVQTLFSQIADQTVANTTTETTMLATVLGVKTVPPNSLIAGSRLKFELAGRISFTGSPTADIRLKLGSTTLITTLGTYPAGTFTDIPVSLKFDVVCRTAGTSGTVRGDGRTLLHEGPGVTSLLARGLHMAADGAVDTTTPLTFDATFQWGTASTSNSLTVTTATLTLER